jgi:hypothetical protein
MRRDPDAARSADAAGSARAARSEDISSGDKYRVAAPLPSGGWRLRRA